MSNDYILTSGGGSIKQDELYHAVQKGAQKKDHKYINRYWKNGRWKMEDGRWNYQYYNPDAEKSSKLIDRH